MSVLAEIKDTLGPFVKLHREELIDQVMQPYDTAAECRTITSEAQAGNTLGIPVSHLSEVVQGFQARYTPKGTFKMGAHKIVQRRHKINISIDPDTIVGEWEGYLYDEKLSRKDMPLVKYILGKLMGKIDEDREIEMVYNGSYVAPTANVASPAAEGVNGFGKVIADHITAGAIGAFPLGVYSAATTFEYVESFFTSIPQLHRYKRLNMYMSPDVLLDYQRDKRNTFNYKLEMSELLKIDFSNIVMKPLPSMVGKKRIFATVPGNLVRAIHKNTTANNLEVTPDDYIVKVMADWHESFGIADTDLFWVNNQV